MVVIRHPLTDHPRDFYQTPPEATRALLAHERLPHGLWEPHCGHGAIAEVLLDAGHAVVATDIEDRGYNSRAVPAVSLTMTAARRVSRPS